MGQVTKQLWHKQNGETEKAFAAFKLYLGLGSGRTIRAAYQKCNGVKSEANAAGYFSTWASENEWTTRAHAFDTWRDSIDDKKYEAAAQKQQEIVAERRQEANNNAWDLYKLLIEKAKQMLAMPLVEQTLDRDGVTVIIKPVKFRFGDAATTIQIADRLARLATDMSTDNVALNVTDHLRRMSDELGVPYDVLQEEYRQLTGNVPTISDEVQN